MDSLGGGFFCALSNSEANLEPMEIDNFAVAIRKKAIAVFCEERSTGTGVFKRAKSFLKLLLVTCEGICCVTARYVAFIWIGWRVAEISCMERLGEMRFSVDEEKLIAESGAA